MPLESNAVHVVVALAAILLAAVLGGELAVRLGQPAVLGELIAGVVLGNLAVWGASGAALATDPVIDVLSRIGVLILLFEVGLEVTPRQMMQVGLSAFLVALLGTGFTLLLGWSAAGWLLPHASSYAHAFVGAALCATSIGITARVLKDMGEQQSVTARVVLGAAVIDDVFGLIILAVLVGVIAVANAGAGRIAGPAVMIVVKSAVFVAGAMAAGRWIMPALFKAATRLKRGAALLPLALALCFAMSWLAAAVGLAAIIGAFAAGLIVEESRQRGLAEQVAPISGFLVPVFFVLMGMRTQLAVFNQPGVLGLAAALTAAAILGKQLCGLGAREPGVRRVAVGVGMIPRGEVALIFANLGLGLAVAGERIVSPAVYSALVAVVIVTTMITPPMLKWALKR